MAAIFGKTNILVNYSAEIPCDSKISSLHFQDKCIFVFYPEIQDGRQKCQENDFWGKSPVEFAYTLWVKNFVEITLSHSVSEINAFLRFTQKFKMAVKSGGKTIFRKSRQ